MKSSKKNFNYFFAILFIIGGHLIKSLIIAWFPSLQPWTWHWMSNWETRIKHNNCCRKWVACLERYAASWFIFLTNFLQIGKQFCSSTKTFKKIVDPWHFLNWRQVCAKGHEEINAKKFFRWRREGEAENESRWFEHY